MIVVSDTSPLTNLAAIGRLDLLRQLYSQVLIPEAVAQELRAGEQLGDHPALLGHLDWIHVHSVSDFNRVQSLVSMFELNRGEAEAIVLAIETNAQALLIDERKGREAATQVGVAKIGVVGVLLAAKEQHLITGIKPILDELIRKAEFWLGRDVYDYALKRAGEANH